MCLSPWTRIVVTNFIGDGAHNEWYENYLLSNKVDDKPVHVKEGGG